MTSDLNYIELANEVTIAYKEQGNPENPTLIFVHGLANYLRVWELNTIELQNNFHCISIDLPGNGMSSRGDYEYSISFFSSKLIELMDALKINKASLVGHSMGGHIAIRCALLFPARIEKLILCAPSGFEYFSNHEAILFKNAIVMGDFLNLDELHITQSIQTSFYKKSYISQKIIDDLNSFLQNNDKKSYRKMIDKCIKSMLEHQVFHELKNIQQPTFAIFGENDMLIPNRFFHPSSTFEIGKKAVSQISNATLKMIPQAGHFVQIEKAKEVNTEILNWFFKN